jgi:hypothetical protein
MDYWYRLVRIALRGRIRRNRQRIGNVQHLQRDLGLFPLDLIVVALELEEGIEAPFPVGLLECVDTVGDLVRLAWAWAEQARESGRQQAPSISGRSHVDCVGRLELGEAS